MNIKGWPEDCIMNWVVQIIWRCSLCRTPHTNSGQSLYTYTLNVNNVRLCKVDCEMITLKIWQAHGCCFYVYMSMFSRCVLSGAQWGYQVSWPQLLATLNDIIFWKYSKFLVFLLIPTGLHMFAKKFSNCT